MDKSRKQRAARQARRRKQLRALTFGVIVVLVLSATSLMLASAFSPKTPPPDADIIDVRADMSGFNVQEIRVKAGEPVTVRLTSLDSSHHTDGGGKHQWAVDELGVNIIAPPLSNRWASFTAETPGTYTFYCDICCGGRANPTMSGKLIVEG